MKGVHMSVSSNYITWLFQKLITTTIKQICAETLGQKMISRLREILLKTFDVLIFNQNIKKIVD